MAQYYRKLSKGIRWFYKLSYNGKVHRSKCIYLTKLEAKRAEAENFKELDQRHRFPELKEDMKLSDLIEARLIELKTNKSQSYHKDNKLYLYELLDYLGNVWVSDIYRSDINSLLLSVADRFKGIGKSNYTPNAMLRVYKAFFNYGIDNFNLNNTNPCRGIKFMSIDQKLKYIPSDEEIELLKSKCDKEQAFLIDFIVSTGARIGECLRFKGKDILSDSIVLYTRKSINSNLTPRKLNIPDCLIGKRYKIDELVFGRWSKLPKFLDKKLRQIKGEKPETKLWGFHNLRHRYASKLSKEGVPIFDIMSKLGHSNISTTQIYLHLLS
ncbi:MAG: tyrosine-type recombinase/integrase [Ignavibacteriaceae bacterium]